MGDDLEWCIVVDLVDDAAEVVVRTLAGQVHRASAGEIDLEGAPQRGTVGRVLAEDGEVIIDLTGVEVFDGVARAVATAPGQFQLQLDFPDTTTNPSPSEVGLPADFAGADAQRMQGKVVRRSVGSPTAGEGWWLSSEMGEPVDIIRWLDLARARSMRGKSMVDSFVNPYTFVPLPPDGSVVRRAPAGHRGLRDGRLMGRLRVSWEAESPVMVRGQVQGGSARFPDGGDGSAVIPGSSVKGAVRSVHETMFGGCLRVFDHEFRPVYRSLPRVRPVSWTLAQVVEVEESTGRPTSLQVCDRVVWVQRSAFSDQDFQKVQTGTRCDIPSGAIQAPFGRDEVRFPDTVRKGREWVVLITDTGARAQVVETAGEPPPYFAATGRLSGRTVEVSDEAWRTYLIAVEDADDLRTGVRRSNKGFKQVMYSYRKVGNQPGTKVPIGFRREASRRFQKGDVLWVEISGGVATELSLSYIWRELGGYPAEKRVPDDLLPCPDPTDLCPSCRLFGAADTRGADRSVGNRQDAYRGHVRFGEARTTRDGPWPIQQLAPLSKPKPGAGQFYLDLAGNTQPGDPDGRAAREWGHPRDDLPGGPRSLRGRKFYWHGGPESQTPWRGAPRGHHQAKVMSAAELAPIGTVFCGDIWFENLSRSELAQLIAAIDPERLLVGEAPVGYGEGEPKLRPHLGGGKPFGLGTVKPLVEVVELADAGSRYGPGAAPEFDLDAELALLASDGSNLPKGEEPPVPEAVRNLWPDVAAVLDTNHVAGYRIWYPPATSWVKPGEDGKRDEEKVKRFDRSFEYFRKTDGMAFNAAPNRPMVPLPDPRELDQYLEIKEN